MGGLCGGGNLHKPMHFLGLDFDIMRDIRDAHYLGAPM
jgi:hypothetical protein